MKLYGVGYYDYKELYEKATAYNASQDDINALGEWFENYGMCYWNGERFEASAEGEPTGTRGLVRIEKQVDEDTWETIGYEFR